jgi:hypothetical protein
LGYFVPLAYVSFTGSRASIRGDINFYGNQGVQFYTQVKTITSNGVCNEGCRRDSRQSPFIAFPLVGFLFWVKAESV